MKRKSSFSSINETAIIKVAVNAIFIGFQNVLKMANFVLKPCGTHEKKELFLLY
jgi:hypothetical protein